MFCNCKSFRCDLSKWDVSLVQGMERLFRGLVPSGYSGLNIRNAYSVKRMFHGADNFDRSVVKSWGMSERALEGMFTGLERELKERAAKLLDGVLTGAT